MQVEVYAADVSKHDENVTAILKLDDLLWSVDIFIANAGIGELCPPDENCSDIQRKIFSVNVDGAVEGIETMKEKMIQRGRGHIVGVTSFAAVRGLPGARMYSASKAALLAYLEAVRAEADFYGLRLSILAPGYIDTDLTRKNPYHMPFLMKVDKAGEYFVDKIVKGKELIIAPVIWRSLFWFVRCIPDGIYSTVSKYVFRRYCTKK